MNFAVLASGKKWWKIGSKIIVLDGLRPDDPMPALPETEINKIPNVTQAMKPRAQVQLQVFDVASNGQILWKADIKKKWSESPAEYSSAFDDIAIEHQDKWMDLLFKADANEDTPSTQVDESEIAQTTPLDAMALEAWEHMLKAKGYSILTRPESCVKHAKLCITSKGVHAIYNSSGSALKIPVKAAIGSHGPGNFAAPSDEKNVLPFTQLFEQNGDQTLMSLDKDNDIINAQPLYKIIRDIEKDEGAKNINLSYHKKPLKRVVKDGRERIEVEIDTPKVYKWDEVKDESKCTYRNAFGLKGDMLTLTTNRLVCLIYKVKWHKIGAALKPRKPYVVTKVPLEIPAGHVLLLNTVS